MASSRAIRAARAFVEIFGDDSKLRRTLKGATARLRSFGRGVASVGKAAFAGFAAAAAVGLAAATAAVTKFVAEGDKIDKMSIRTGVSAEALSQLGFAAEQSGSSLDDLGRGLKGMANFLQGAERGLSTSTDTMEDLGLKMADLESLTPDERFELFAEKIAAIEDPTRRAAVAMDVFGRAGEQLLPLLNQGPEGIAALREEADSLGRTISQKQAADAAALADAWNRMKSAASGAAIQLGAALAPAITGVVNSITDAIGAAKDWIGQNELVSESLSLLTDALSSGEFAAAGRVLWISLQEVWLKGIEPLREAWIGFKVSFLQITDELVIGAKTKLSSLQNDLAGFIVKFQDALGIVDGQEVQQTLKEDFQRRITTIEQEAGTRQASREAAVSDEYAELQRDMAQARAALQSARDEARKEIDKATERKRKADEEVNRAIEDATINIENATVATTGPQSSGDLRSVSGAGQLVALFNRQSNVENQQLRAMNQIRELQKRMVTLAENGPQFVRI